MKGIRRLVIATAAWAVVSTCGGPRVELPVDFLPPVGAEVLDASSSDAVAQVRFVNLLDQVGAVAVVADQHLAFRSVGYRSATGYAEVGARGTRFELRGPDGAVLAAVAHPLSPAGRYALIATRTDAGTPSLQLVGESPHARVSGSTR